MSSERLYKALKGLLEIEHRLSGCSVEDCLICKDTQSKLKEAHSAVKEFEDGQRVENLLHGGQVDSENRDTGNGRSAAGARD